MGAPLNAFFGGYPEMAENAELAALKQINAELLSALKGAISYMEEAETNGLVGDEGCHWPVEIARAAIAKAEGRQ